MAIEDPAAAAALAADARRLRVQADDVPLPRQRIDGWASPAARAYADDVLALQHRLIEVRGELAELAALLASAVP